jgi:hypothetical protein
MSDYAIIQLARAVVPALAALGAAGVLAAAAVIVTGLRRGDRKRLGSIERRLEGIEQRLQAPVAPTGRVRLEEPEELKQRIETLESIVVDRETRS